MRSYLRRLLTGALAATLAALLIGTAAAQDATIGLSFTASRFLQGLESGDHSFTRLVPPDTNGAVGPDHIVELINDHYSVFRKSDGARLNSITETDVTFWQHAGLPVTDDPGITDPRVVYDRGSGRWFATEITYPVDSNGLWIPDDVLVAVSNTSDPTQGWRGYRIAGTDPGTFPDPSMGATGFWVDQPSLGVNATGVYIATNNYTVDAAGDSHNDSTSIFVVRTADLVAGKPPRITRLSRLDLGTTGFSLHAAMDDGTIGGAAVLIGVPYALYTQWPTPVDNLLAVTVTGAGRPGSAAVAGPAQSIDVPPYQYPWYFAIQPDGTRSLDAGDGRMASSIYRVAGSIWLTHNVTVDHSANGPAASRSGIRWYRLDAQTLALAESGTIEDEAHDYYEPAIAANERGDVVIGCTRSGATEFPSVYAVVGQSRNGSTSFGEPMLVKAGVDSYHDVTGLGYHSDRWGDYSRVQVDPVDPKSFWLFQQWADTQFVPPLGGWMKGRWATQVTQIIVP